MKNRYFNVHPIATSFSNFARTWLNPGSRVTTAKMRQHFDVASAHQFKVSLNRAFIAHRYMSNCYNLGMF